MNEENLKIATLGAGCFWCVEAIFLNMKGVTKVESGYTGGNIENPTYKDVCTGLSGHAEVVQITFDENILSFEKILEVFWKTHDPTTLNRQGNDVGTQYRSSIFYHTQSQKEIATISKIAAEKAKLWDDEIVTTIEKYDENNYYLAENYHQNYLELNPQNPYCTNVVKPKVEKFKMLFKSLLKG